MSTSPTPPLVPSRPRQAGSGNADLDRRLLDMLEEVGATANRDQLLEMLVTVLRLAGDDASRLDLKITNAALKEMRNAFAAFAPYRDVPKITMFGSARTLADDPLYGQARDLAHALAGEGWMVVTGAGPGIMAAGLEGAGREMSFGVNIRLPFEAASPLLAGDPKLTEMKYFFTRKLMLLKESDGFVALPGGFGTLDEVFELLTLLQTGKAEPSPVVLLEVPGGTYWQEWAHLVTKVAARGLISADDHHLWRITDDVATAAAEILGFYRNYHSRRFVGDRLVIRLRKAPTGAELDELGRRFADICRTGTIEATGPLPAEEADHDHLDLPRIAFVFDRLHQGRLRELIDALNG
ncbi:MAG: TIGR00730 family Rossman fold protein [Actinobacteria bacterium]|nr:TIGR00730 family Rossman fold protein [Actinomycetota bacterium]